MNNSIEHGWILFHFTRSQGKYITKVNGEIKEITTKMLMQFNHTIDGDNGWIEMPTRCSERTSE